MMKKINFTSVVAVLSVFLIGSGLTFGFAGGDGSADNPWQISTKAHLDAVNDDLAAHYIMINDIDLSPQATGEPAYTSAVIAPDTSASYGFQGTVFTGLFDGNGYKIMNLTINTSGAEIDYLGLFGYLDDGAITDLGLDPISITSGDCRYIGGLAAVNDGSITNCYVVGVVTGNSSSGGLVWDNNSSIINCYTDVEITAGAAGGLMCYNDGSVINSYSSNNVTATNGDAGGLVIENGGNIINCHATGIVTASTYAGGLVTKNNQGSNIIKSYATGSVTGSYDGAGLAHDNSGTIIDCYATGDVYGSGGLVRYNTSNGVVQNCHATGNVSGSLRVGGLVGDNWGSISCSYAIGDVTGTWPEEGVGALVGLNYSGQITNCYAEGNANIITTHTMFLGVGGLVGDNEHGTVSNCYSIGSATGPSSPWFDNDVGGLTGFGDADNSFWDIQTSGNDWSDGGVGLTTIQMQTQSTFTNAGWDFVGESINGVEDIWIMNGYPKLNLEHLATPFYTVTFLAGSNGSFISGCTEQQIPHGFSAIALSVVPDQYWVFDGWDTEFSEVTGDLTVTALYDVDGSVHNPHRIYTVEDLEAVNNDLSAYYVLMNDLDLSGKTYTTAVIAPDTSTFHGGFQGTKFTGSFNGMGHIISNLNIEADTDGYVALFGYVDNGGHIYDLGTENVSINGGGYVGSLIGYSSYGNINDCFSTGQVSGYNSVGGLIGINYYGDIDHCYFSAGVISGNDNIGGLVGESFYGTIDHCYISAGIITGNNSVGGLVGKGGANMECCYSSAEEIHGNIGVGGLIGSNLFYWQDINNCYSSGGEVYGVDYVGGLIGGTDVTINSCYASVGINSSGNNIGGFLGNHSYSCCSNNCFWDVNTSGIGISGDNNYGATGKTTIEMQNSSTFIDSSWDFNSETNNGTDDIWHMPYLTSGYPMLFFQRDIPADTTGKYGVGLKDYATLASGWLDEYDLDDLIVLASHWLEGK